MRIAVPILFALLASLAASVRAEPPTPMLWRIDGEGGRVYLLGSMHMLQPSDYPLAPEVLAAQADAEELVFEVDPAEMRSGASSGQMMRLGALPTGESLQQHVSTETWQALQGYVDGGGFLPMSAIERMRPWFLSVTLAIMEMQRAGLNPAHGLDQHFMRQQARDGKPAAGLEAVSDQLALLSGGSDAEQEQQLRQTLDQLADFDGYIGRMHALWRSGDADGLHAMIAAEMKDYPALYRRMFVDRNRAWIPRIEAHIADAGDELIIVGAAHLPGEDGVIELLRARGHRVERVTAAEQ